MVTQEERVNTGVFFLFLHLLLLRCLPKIFTTTARRVRPSRLNQEPTGRMIALTTDNYLLCRSQERGERVAGGGKFVYVYVLSS